MTVCFLMNQFKKTQDTQDRMKHLTNGGQTQSKDVYNACMFLALPE